MKKYRVFWTKEAAIDLEEIVGYISRDRATAAKSIYKTIKQRCRELNHFPEKYRAVPELQEIGITDYREIIHSPYRIVYKLTGSNIFIIAVVDGRRDFETFIFNRLLREGST